MKNIAKKIACIIIFYRPKLSILQKWITFAKSDKHIDFIFIDNTEKGFFTDKYLKYTENFQTYKPLDANMGIAFAQNTGISIAQEHACKYVIFFDQDSDPSKDLIISLRDSFIRLSKEFRVGAVGPRIINKSLRIADRNTSTKIEETDKLISSGTLTSLDVLEEAGGLENSLFIDQVDHEWCWRVKALGFKIFRINSETLIHQIGIKDIKFCGVYLHMTAPIRYFYYYRNTRRLLFRRYVPIKWKLASIKRLIQFFCLMPLCKSFKGKKLEIYKQAFNGFFLAK